MASAKVKLGLKELSLTDKIQLARQIVTKMTGNPSFAAPTPNLGAITNAANAAQNAYNDAQNARATAQQKTVAQNEKDAALDTALTQLAAYVESAAAGDEQTILSSGMGVRGGLTAPMTPPQPQSLAATAGDAEGTLDLTWDPSNGAKSYTLELSTVGGTGPWTHAGVITKSSMMLKGLTSGQRVWVRVAPIGAAGQGPWSDPATKIVP